MSVQPVVFVAAQAPAVAVEHARPPLVALAPYEKGDADALLDVEHVVVLVAVGRDLLFSTVAVQVERVNLAEAVHQGLAHAAKGRIVQPTMIGDEGQHAFAVALDAPLSEADELDVVVPQQLRVSFSQRRAVYEEVIALQFTDPVALVGAVAAVGRVAQHDHDGLVVLDPGGGVGLGRDVVFPEFRLNLAAGDQRVGQQDVESRVLADAAVGAVEKEAQTHVRQGVGRHQ